MQPTRSSSTGFLVETETRPPWLPRELERSGVATAAAWTADGLYAEAGRTLGGLLRALEQAGVQVVSVQRGTRGQGWWTTARPARGAAARLCNPRSACWLPTG